ncbi:YadA-like family protein [Burkholderia territorii]|uniref:YadA-like family protein n=3 Tax=Burkholderia territorii TaxID=1503055 RepID=UPI002012006D|nr:YadA-like family protein [Burkholderia territorii]
MGTTTARRQIVNVAAGTQANDAVVLSQLTPVVTALGGGASINATTGAVTGPTYNLANGGRQTTVGGALTALDGAVTASNQSVGDLRDSLQNSGLIDPTTGESLAVTYTDASKSAVTLGNDGTPVRVSNVADGAARTDAANVGQVTDAVDSIRNDLADGTLNMRYIKVNATGAQANAIGTNAVAIGSNANATSNGSLAIGTGARASGLNAIALGLNSVATQANTVSVGSIGNERKIVNVAEGDVDANSTDAINGSQLYAAMNSLTSTLDAKTKALESNTAGLFGINSASAGINDVTAPLVAVEGQNGDNIASLNGADPATSTAAAIGVLSAASGSNAIAVGLQTVAGSDNSVAIGSLAQTGAGQDYSVAMGSDAQTNGTQAVAIGAHVQANADNALAVGNNNTLALSQSSIALGDGARVNAGATNSVAMGKSATIGRNVTNALALGADTNVTANGGIALGQGSVANRGNALSIGGGTVGQRQIINVAAGTQGTDAVNVNQLRGVTNALGGGATVGADGSIVAPVYTIGTETFDNVEDALKAAASQGGSSADAVSYDDPGHTSVTLGNAGTPVSIHNVAPGAVSSASTDAINGSQLFGTAQSVAGALGGGAAVGADGTITAPTYTIGGTDLHNVGDALTNLDGRTQANSDGLSDLRDKLSDGGVIDPTTGESLAVTYTDANKTAVQLGNAGTPVTVQNVAAGALSATSTDAVNGSQLFATNTRVGSLEDTLSNSGLIDPTTGESLAVTYTDANKTAVQLGNAGTPVTVRNVAAGALSATSTDAVNGSQLFATNQSIGDLKDSLSQGGVIDPTTGESLAVTYTDANKTAVQLGNAGTPVRVSNVADAVADNDAVNLKQLRDSGLIGEDPNTGDLTSLAVTYDDATKAGITLGNAGTPVSIHNVAPGAVSSASTDAINGSQLFGTAQSVAGALGGGAAVGADGTITAPTYTIGGTDLHNVGDALTNLDGRTQANSDGLSDLRDKLSDGGVIDPTTGESLAVTYTDANKTAVQLGNTGTPVTVQNVAAGALSATSTDAVNGSQLFATNTRVGSLEDTLSNSGLIDPTTGESLAVTYTDANKTAVQLGNAGTPVTLQNVAPGALSATSTDAVNGSQLFATNQSIGDLKDSLSQGGVIDPTTGESLAVTYTNAGKTAVQLGNAGTPVRVSNVADAVADNDAVNLKQLRDSGLIGEDPNTGDLTSLAVTYDDATKAGITLGNAGTPVSIHNVAAGAVSATSADAINGSQLFGTAQSVAGALGGGAAVGADGTITAPTYTIGGTDLHNVGDALTNLDGRTQANSDGLSDLRDKLSDGGVIDPTTGESLAVTYTDANKTAVQLGNTGTPVTVQNVAAGALSATSTDAVNGSQLFATNTRVGSLEDTLSNSGLIDPTTGESLAVTYTDANKTAVQLGNAGTPVTLQNVAPGALSATSTDAVNGSQLFATNQSIGDLKDSLSQGGVIDPTTGESLAVTYTNAGKTAVQLGNAGTPVRVSNVAAGTAGTDAVNVSQLTSGLSDLRDDLTNGAIDLRYIKVNATGTAALATGAQGVAIGSGASSSGPNSLALGSGARSSANGAVAIGFNSVANQANTVSVGSIGNERKIVNVAAGDLSAGSTDAINGSQLYSALNGLTTTLKSETDQKIAELSAKSIGVNDATDPLVAIDGQRIDNYASLNGGDPASASAIAVGVASVASGSNTTAIGLQALAGSDNSVAIGSFAQTGNGQPYAVAMGSDAQTNGAEAVALGAHVQANADNALAVGSNSNAIGKSSIALGNGAQALAGTTNAIAAGTGATVALNVADAIALGANASVAAGANGGIALGAGSVANRGNALSIGSAGAERQIINVAAGTQKTDAVNVGQLAGVTGALGGGAAVGADGSIVQPTYTVNGKDYTNVADAIDAAAASGGAPVEGAVTYDDATTKSSLTLAGVDGTTISNVKAGAVSATSMDAINGSQLFGTAQSVAGALGGGSTVNPDGTVTAPTYTVGGTNVHTVGDALTNLDGRTQANADGLSNLRDKLSDGGVFDPATGESLALTYTDGTRTAVKLGNDGTPVRVSNVADGVDDHDAVNVSQLKSTGLVGDDGNGNLTSLAVGYDDAQKGSITLGGANGTTITNVAAGAVSAASTDAINGSQLYGSAQSVADAIGGGTTVDADGKLAGTAIEVNGYKYKTVSEAVQAAAAYGATDPQAVRYDLNGDGTVNYGSVTLGGSAAAPVVLTNVANGTSTYDAVNYGQLSDLRTELSDRIGSMDDRVVRLEQGSGSGGGSGGGDLIGGTAGDGGNIVPADPGNGNGNVAIGSGSSISDGVNNGTAIGSSSNVGGSNGTAIGSGSSAGGEGSTAIGQGSSVAAGAGNSVAIGQGSVATEANTVSFGNGTDDGNRRIVNIADGINASDAATKGQLDRAVGGLQGQINDVSKNAYSGIAAATALTMIPGVDPGKTLSFGVGGATYKGYQAVAFGGEARITQNLKMKAGVGLSSGGNTVGVGASYQW